MESDRVVHQVWTVFEPELNAHGFELVEVEFAGGRPRILRLYIDKAGGVTLDDCQLVSQMLGPVLDKTDAIEGRYVLEVSSPGFERPVRKPGDFERFAGEEIRIMVSTPVSGRRQYHGILRGIRDGMVRVECDGTVHEVHIENLKRARLVR